ncbi:M28 family peptidase [uncultured Lacinutrix sp.]|uniref:M28 family peptidase n=1 Tax=uncultured Lacinutrix sp. TaxID=574032 RepID=UPI002639ACE3|nr:M28 family peptidase [uncultured Lacinutrix sp.]
MFKKQIYFLLISILLVNCKSTKTTQEVKSLSSKNINYFDILNNEFTGNLAYETTAFVEKYWRVVGNTGFNKSINFIAEHLEKAGYVNEDNATPNDILTYRIEKRPLKKPTWEPVSALVTIEGENKTLLQQTTNSNMVALNSYSTTKEGVTAEVVHIKNIINLKNTDVKGKIIFVESHPAGAFQTGVIKGGAVGILSYSNPNYLQPEKNTTSIQFRSIPLNEDVKGWAIAMSYASKEHLKKALNKGKVTLNVKIETKIYQSEELTIVADIKGSKSPNERLVFSAHVQEPGANDNATGVGVALEMASISARLIKENKWSPNRTLTFLWGDEIISTRRYVQENKARAKDIKWGISLDMVGENTDITGGSFLIEKMPDPSAIWTRGNDKHTEWGGSKMSLEQMKPHYLNDFLIHKFKEQGERANWIVNTNPFEGGSDHVPFLSANIPSVLFWHFTDQFYHTDNDRIDKVSKTTLKNVGTASLVSAYTLLNSDENLAKDTIKQIENSAIERLNEELVQSKIALEKGDKLKTQVSIIKAWKDWYIKAIETTKDMVDNTSTIQQDIINSQNNIKARAITIINSLKN